MNKKIYIIAVKIDNSSKPAMFQFDTEQQRKGFIEDLKKKFKKISYATTTAKKV